MVSMVPLSFYHFIQYFSVVLILTSLCLVEGHEYSPIVKLPNGRGQIRGVIHSPDGEIQAYFYQGIRFAKAVRFGKPEPVTSWPETKEEGEIYDAIDRGHTCLQFGTDFSMEEYISRNQSEDCLFLNIFKPIRSNRDGKLPVMAWIYGGGFQIGTIFTQIYDGSYLATIGDVIVVTINYRLGALGFLYGGNEDAPGNQGFHDQILALKWIQDNIESFGGDPNSVTIFGESAGAFSVSTLILSPMAKGLFHRSILQSGARFMPTDLFSTKSHAMYKTKMFAEKLNCKQEDIRQLLDCLRSKSIEEIYETGKGTLKNMMLNQMIGPMFDDQVLAEDAARWEKGLNQGDIMFGVTLDEGSMFVSSLIPKVVGDQNQFTMEEVKQEIRNVFGYHKTLKEYYPDAEEIVEYYTKNLDVTNLDQVRKMFSDFFGDYRLTCPTMLFAHKAAHLSNVGHNFYGYRFDRRFETWANLANCTSWMGVCHAADIMYTFGSPYLKMSPEDRQLSNELIQAFTQFAQTGRPRHMGSVEWEPAFSDPHSPKSSARLMKLDVGNTYEMIDNYYQNVCEMFWGRKLMIWDFNDSNNRNEL